METSSSIFEKWPLALELPWMPPALGQAPVACCLLGGSEAESQVSVLRHIKAVPSPSLLWG